VVVPDDYEEIHDGGLLLNLSAFIREVAGECMVSLLKNNTETGVLIRFRNTCNQIDKSNTLFAGTGKAKCFLFQ
jgi:hypothetical protein